MRPAVLLIVGVAACGDNAPGDPCAVEHGELRPDLRQRLGALAPPDGCVPGAISADLSGRWHQWDGGATSIFNFGFPVLRVSCSEGLSLPGVADGVFTRASSDELLWIRSTGEGDEVVRACVTAGGALAASRYVCGGPSCERRPIELTRFDRLPGEGEGDGLRLLGESAGTAALSSMNVRVRGDHAYLAQRGGLRIFDVGAPDAAPRQVGFLARAGDDGSDYNDLKLVDAGARRFAILAGAATPIVEVTDPTAPRFVAQIGEYSHSVFVDEHDGRQRLYLATYGQDVPVFDVTDPTAPLPLGRAIGPDGLRVHDLFADDGMIYANGSEHGFLVLDARASIGQAAVLGSTPAMFSHASWVGVLGGRRVAIHGDEGHGAHLRMIDVDPTSPEFMRDIGSWQTREEVSIHNLMLVGDTAYVAHYQDGVRLVDVSDPTAPRQIAYYNTWDPATGPTGAFSGALGIDVDAATGRVYVADLVRGLLVLSRP